MTTAMSFAIIGCGKTADDTQTVGNGSQTVQAEEAEDNQKEETPQENTVDFAKEVEALLHTDEFDASRKLDKILFYGNEMTLPMKCGDLETTGYKLKSAETVEDKEIPGGWCSDYAKEYLYALDEGASSREKLYPGEGYFTYGFANAEDDTVLLPEASVSMLTISGAIEDWGSEHGPISRDFPISIIAFEDASGNENGWELADVLETLGQPTEYEIEENEYHPGYVEELKLSYIYEDYVVKLVLYPVYVSSSFESLLVCKIDYYDAKILKAIGEEELIYKYK